MVIPFIERSFVICFLMISRVCVLNFYDAQLSILTPPRQTYRRERTNKKHQHRMAPP